MKLLETIFWVCTAGVAYAYVAYPLVMFCLARTCGKEVRRRPYQGTVSIVVAAHNEESRIARRRDEFQSLLRQGGLAGEVLIVSDGSTDHTATVARTRAAADVPVRVVELAENVGKAAALTRGCATATGDVLVFADARQRWAPDALRLLLESFADPAVGGVSGDLCLESSDGTAAGVGLYWRYEKAVRKLETCVHSTVGATGAISAVRRTLFRPIPPRTILDDVYWPMQVVMQGFRVVHNDTALAFDRLPDNARDEFRRKVRTLSGNFQLVGRLPSLLVPWRNPLWLQFLSHKLMRLAVPWLLAGMFVSSALLLRMPFYRVVFVLQAAAFAVALAGLHRGIASRFRIASAAAAFVVLNAAAWMSFWVWISGRSAASWRKVHYGAAAAKPAVGQV